MKRKQGFTLIELLVSIAIIAVLSIVVTGWVGNAKAKSRDTQALREMKEVQTALNLYLAEYNVYPNWEPITTNPYVGNFVDMAQELLSENLLTKVPTPPAGRTYQYYNYGPGGVGALLITTLETYPPSTGYAGSCRPFAPGTAPWCTSDSNNFYCLCSPY